MKYANICFVVMPFGVKTFGGCTIDFDSIYSEIFEPAISSVVLPEGGLLEARRTDKDLFSGNISKDMFEYLEYSRLVFADLTSLNPNVMYELGHRHRARLSGTILFRQTDCHIPFDLNQIKSFPYEFEPDEHAEESRSLIAKVLTESLIRNHLDSPIQLILKAQQESLLPIDSILQKAENAILHSDIAKAVVLLKEAVSMCPGNAKINLELGLLYKYQGDWLEALQCFSKATRAQADYSEAWRERGISENKLFYQEKATQGLPIGEDSLRRALELDPKDFDALSSLGGILKRKGEMTESADCYLEAASISNGNSYPLLNGIKIRGQLSGSLKLSDKEVFLLSRAQKSLRAQVASKTPYNAPWSFFDLAEIYFFLGDFASCLRTVDEGLLVAEGWQVQTFLESLTLISCVAADVEGFSELLERVKDAKEYLV